MKYAENKEKTKYEMARLSSNISLIPLTINGLNM